MLHIAHHPAYIHPVREGHRFPMLKYELIPAQLLREGVVSQADFFEPSLATKEVLYMAHDQSYIDDLLDLKLSEKMIRRIGFPLTQALVDRERYLVDGTVKGSLYALEHGIAFNTAGGTHHAGRDFGEGFCLVNDQAVAACFLRERKLAARVLIIDLDVHQGNGTAHIFAGSSSVFTFSMHADKNYPFIKERSFRDVPLEDGIDDASYLSLLETHLFELFEEIRPDFVFYQSGVDVLATDKLGKLKLTTEGCQRRDALVFSYAKNYKTPIQVSMGGGYSIDIKDIVNAHVATFKAAIACYNL
ncbi:histone deacetylase family protein [Sphingobacterium psychroaquaticum]|uniref:Acetoin utilization deacetylase AcuC n=1 Tax=Sphingobacterium psychroaquaticum TaxID=561061 RepID=A0A1X7JSE6_9SPHI|nr:histone deacetylase [Sphingobacterium psychroaquaticum]SMG30702.1 Acetoin utilization deacetylase AcuC [Sphingobacterium psychroaquaticum]